MGRAGRHHLALAAMVAMAAGPAAAQEPLRPTPGYFAEAVFDITMAQALGRSCPSVSLDPVRASARADALLAALEADGFSTDAPQDQMQDPDAAIRDLQAGFVARYAIDQPSEARICEIAMAEIAAATGIGALLVEAPG